MPWGPFPNFVTRVTKFGKDPAARKKLDAVAVDGSRDSVFLNLSLIKVEGPCLPGWNRDSSVTNSPMNSTRLPSGFLVKQSWK